MLNLENNCLKGRDCATMVGLVCNASDKERINND
jgi:hypothetical protein